MATQNNHTPRFPQRQSREKVQRRAACKDRRREEETDFGVFHRQGTSADYRGCQGHADESVHPSPSHLREVVELILKELADAIKDCSGMSNNLNQLTMKFHAAFKDVSDKRLQKLARLTPQLEYQSQMIGQILIHIANLCSQR